MPINTDIEMKSNYKIETSILDDKECDEIKKDEAKEQVSTVRDCTIISSTVSKYL